MKVWDTIGEDKILKGEYKVLGGRMYVVLISISCLNETDRRRSYVVTISTGMERAKELSLDRKSVV